MTTFTGAHREEYGVEPICKVLLIAPSTWAGFVYAAFVIDAFSRRIVG